MSYPNIPNVNPDIDVNREQVINLLLASIALEELGLSHVINSEAEKIQYILGTIEGQTPSEEPPTIENLLDINRSVERTLRTVIKNQMLLQFKLEDVLDIQGETTTTTTTTATTTTISTTITTTTTTINIDAGSAWSVGISFGQGNAQYTTLGSTETEKTVVLGLGNTYIPVGTVQLSRIDNSLAVTLTSISPYVMDQVHLYVSDVPPTNSNPGGFPYQYTVTNPSDYFTTYTFNVDVSSFIGKTLYIAAHAHIIEEI